MGRHFFAIKEPAHSDDILGTSKKCNNIGLLPWPRMFHHPGRAVSGAFRNNRAHGRSAAPVAEVPVDVLVFRRGMEPRRVRAPIKEADRHPISQRARQQGSAPATSAHRPTSPSPTRREWPDGPDHVVPFVETDAGNCGDVPSHGAGRRSMRWSAARRSSMRAARKTRARTRSRPCAALARAPSGVASRGRGRKTAHGADLGGRAGTFALALIG